MTVETLRSGIDLSHVETSVRPQDDLFGHVNGRWLAEYQMPGDRATDGAFRTLYDRAEEQVRELIMQAAAAAAPPGTDEQRIGDLYASFLDADAVEHRGVQPLLTELAAIAAAADPTALAAVIGVLQRTGVGGGVGLYIDTDSKNSSRYLVHVSQSGLGLPDESYYRDEQHASILGAYPATSPPCSRWCSAAPPTSTRRAGGRIVALETKDRRRALGRRQAP